MDRALQIAAAELARRETEALRLFRPQEHQLPVFTSTASEILVQGGSRAGKSMCMAARIASAATGQAIIGPDGKELPFLYPRNRPLTIWLIGKELDHCPTWHRLLFEPQPELKWVYDLETNQPRCYDPRTDRDRDDWQIMGPMIPHRFIQGGYNKGIAWLTKRKKIFRKVTLLPRPEFGPKAEGTTLYFWPSSGEVKKGDPVDIIGIDEHIEIPSHFNEWQVRLSDRRGHIIWAICPDIRSSHALNELIVRCEKEEVKCKTDGTKPRFERIELWFTDNKYIDDDQKSLRRESMTPAEWANRNRGALFEADTQVYPEFCVLRHGTPVQDDKPEPNPRDDAVDKLLRENGGTIPDDWCRDLIVDPGSAHPGVLMCALPPPELGVECGIVYDELYFPNSDPMLLAEALRTKIEGQQFYRFILDGRAGVQRTIGTSVGKNTAILYADAFRHYNITSYLTGSNFILSPSDWLAGVQAVKLRLANMPAGRPWLRYLRGRCYNFCRMMERYERAKDKKTGYLEDKPAQKQIDPLVDCLRYWIVSEPYYNTPPKRELEGGAAWRLYQQIEEEKTQRAQSQGVFLGAGAISN